MSVDKLQNIPYLENNDFQNGRLKNHVSNGKPTLILIYGEFCPHCSNFKKAYQAVRDSGVLPVSFATVQVDNDDCVNSTVLTEAITTYSGSVPMLVLMNEKGEMIKEFKGERTEKGIKDFVRM